MIAAAGARIAQERFLEAGKVFQYPPRRDDDTERRTREEKNKDLQGRWCDREILQVSLSTKPGPPRGGGVTTGVILGARRRGQAPEGAGGLDDTGVGDYTGGAGDFSMFEVAPF
jgi:hypothetical protein